MVPLCRIEASYDYKFKANNQPKYNKHILGKISRNTGILYLIKDQLPIKARINFYYSLIYPYLIYSVPVWGGTNQVHLKPIVLQQKRAIRIIAGAGYRDHTNPLFHRLEILKISDQKVAGLLPFCRRFFNSAAPHARVALLDLSPAPVRELQTSIFFVLFI